MINKEEFLRKCEQKYNQLKKDNVNYHIDFIFKPYKEKSKPLIKIEIGGVSGGSCWDNSNPKPYTSDYIIFNIDDFIYDILLDVNYNIPLLISRNIKNECTKEYINTEYEYYGNNTCYRNIEIDFDKMADILFENEYF